MDYEFDINLNINEESNSTSGKIKEEEDSLVNNDKNNEIIYSNIEGLIKLLIILKII